MRSVPRSSKDRANWSVGKGIAEVGVRNTPLAQSTLTSLKGSPKKSPAASASKSVLCQIALALKTKSAGMERADQALPLYVLRVPSR